MVSGLPFSFTGFGEKNVTLTFVVDPRPDGHVGETVTSKYRSFYDAYAQNHRGPDSKPPVLETLAGYGYVAWDAGPFLAARAPNWFEYWRQTIELIPAPLFPSALIPGFSATQVKDELRYDSTADSRFSSLNSCPGFTRQAGCGPSLGGRRTRRTSTWVQAWITWFHLRRRARAVSPRPGRPQRDHAGLLAGGAGERRAGATSDAGRRGQRLVVVSPRALIEFDGVHRGG